MIFLIPVTRKLIYGVLIAIAVIYFVVWADMWRNGPSSSRDTEMKSVVKDPVPWPDTKEGRAHVAHRHTH